MTYYTLSGLIDHLHELRDMAADNPRVRLEIKGFSTCDLKIDRRNFTPGIVQIFIEPDPNRSAPPRNET